MSLKKDGTKATTNISIPFNKGEFTATIVSSYSGRSAVLNLIGRLDNPMSDKKTCDNAEGLKKRNKQITDFKFHKIELIFLQFHFPPMRTSLENVLTLLLSRRIPHKKIELAKAMRIITKKDEVVVSNKGGVIL